MHFVRPPFFTMSNGYNVWTGQGQVLQTMSLPHQSRCLTVLIRRGVHELNLPQIQWTGTPWTHRQDPLDTIRQMSRW